MSLSSYFVINPGLINSVEIVGDCLKRILEISGSYLSKYYYLYISENRYEFEMFTLAHILILILYISVVINRLFEVYLGITE